MRASLEQSLLSRTRPNDQGENSVGLKYSPALTERFRQSLLPVALTLLPAFNCHIKSAEMVFEFQVDRPLSSREDDFLNRLT